MALTGEQLELPYLIPTSENVSQVLRELRKPEAASETVAERDQDFLLFRQRGSREPWRWEGIREHAGAYSERNFKTEEQAITDAQSKLKP